MPRRQPLPVRLPHRLLAAATAVVVTGSLAIAVLAAPPPAAAAFTPTDYCLGECADILPPGQNGNATLAGILLHQTVGTLPAHSRDQLDKYANLVYGYAGLREDQISTFFNEIGRASCRERVLVTV